MPPLRDAAILSQLRLAFKERTSDGVRWKPLPVEWVRKNLGCTQRAIDDLLYEHIDSGGEIDQVVEDRDGYRHHGYHYDFRICVSERRVYVETILYQGRMGPIVTIVNVHDV